ncbi:peroxisomal biogenesis factor 11 [Phycomyces nitens]|nr:peroxisomal biogenesis factor 11 [Phycomyces nitens]
MAITHAHIEAFNRYLATTAGREKACRLVQYFARFYAFYLLRTGAPKEAIQRWADLKSSLGTGRKFFRLLKPVEFAQNGVKSLAIKDEVIRAGTFVKQFGYFFYYCCEAANLANTIKFYKLENIKTITRFGTKCWLAGLTASLLTGIYKFKQLEMRAQMLKKSSKALTGKEADSSERLAELQAEKKQLAKDAYSARYQFLQDSIDILIPLGGLEILPLDEGVLGLAGMATSMLAMNTQWKKVNK